MKILSAMPALQISDVNDCVKYKTRESVSTKENNENKLQKTPVTFPNKIEKNGCENQNSSVNLHFIFKACNTFYNDYEHKRTSTTGCSNKICRR